MRRSVVSGTTASSSGTSIAQTAHRTHALRTGTSSEFIDISGVVRREGERRVGRRKRHRGRNASDLVHGFSSSSQELSIALHLLTCDLVDELPLRLLCNLIGANRQFPIRPDEMARVAGGISLEVILMLWFGLPEVSYRHDFRYRLARPQT